MMKKLKSIKTLVTLTAGLLAILLPLGVILPVAMALPDQYEETFYGALDDKFDRLVSIEEEKIVVIGGSSVAFGLDSAMMEKYTGMPVVNFGLYAALGTKLMLDLSRHAIKAGDVVVLAPELSPQTMSMYFNSEFTLRAMDGDYHMMRYVGTDNIFSLIGAMFEHLGKKIQSMGADYEVDEVYNSSNFNEYGDVIYDRPENIMGSYYDKQTPIKLDESILDPTFIDYMNEYIADCRRAGAEVYFSYCPMNELGMHPDTSDEASISAFDDIIAESLDCDVISYAMDYVLPAGYFYDSNFHLNNAGVKYRTINLTKDLLFAMEQPTVVAEELPEEPELKSGLIMVDERDENQKYFTYEKLDNGNWKITGLTDEGKKMQELIIPIGVFAEGEPFGTAVTSIGEEAFAGASAMRIYIPEGSYVESIENGAFMGADKVRHLYISISDPKAIKPPSTQENGFRGANSSLTIHVPKGAPYNVDYYWSEIPKWIKLVDDIAL
jgi:hypothetical protein